MKTYNIAVVPGDGIGQEIVPEGIRVIDAVAAGYFKCDYTFFPYSAEHYQKTGEFMPSNALEILRPFDAIYFGAIGHPDVDDTLPATRYTFRVRKGFHQYVNYRPIKILPGVPSPLRAAKAGEVDFVIVRENTEGEFSETGNIIHPETPGGFAIQTSIFTRHGIERVAHYAFQLARKRKGLVTNVTKSNTLIHSMLYWDQLIGDIARAYPEVKYERMYVDNASANFILRPQHFDVILTTNMIGDILSDLGGALMGSLGLAPSGNINPEKEYPSMFEPIHGSAPDIAFKGIANPVSAIWSGALMLEHLGEDEAAQRIEAAICTALSDRSNWPADLGGTTATTDVTDSIISVL
ncbi:tartrate dehydrogenase [candidate division KSB1 bacterium]|nr:tartrate dehydrogenase [candidate division KSB1 bacterium]RQW06314.1 MAG: tartrate dehydrogenase [candidate division KSB1 bacterium]